MYKYFKELDKPNDFMTLCKNDGLPERVPLIMQISQSKSDILLRLCGFRRIELSLEKNIITSSICSLSNFSLYEENGWTIQVIPAIKYDKEKDAFVDEDLNEFDDKKEYGFS